MSNYPQNWCCYSLFFLMNICETTYWSSTFNLCESNGIGVWSFVKLSQYFLLLFLCNTGQNTQVKRWRLYFNRGEKTFEDFFIEFSEQQIVYGACIWGFGNRCFKFNNPWKCSQWKYAVTNHFYMCYFTVALITCVNFNFSPVV